MLATAHAYRYQNTKGKRPKYRELPGLESRTPRLLSKSPTPPASTHAARQAKAEPPQAPQPQPEPPKSLDWDKGYSKCPIFLDPYDVAIHQQGEAVSVEPHTCLRVWGAVLAYLHPRRLAHFRSTVPLVPNTDSIYPRRSYDARKSRSVEEFLGPQPILLLAGYEGLNY